MAPTSFGPQALVNTRDEIAITRPFPLLSVPKEVRSFIYKFVLAKDHTIWLDLFIARAGPLDYTNTVPPRQCFKDNILLACKLVYEEALPVLFEINTFKWYRPDRNIDPFTVSFAKRFSSIKNLDCHVHLLCPDAWGILTTLQKCFPKLESLMLDFDSQHHFGTAFAEFVLQQAKRQAKTKTKIIGDFHVFDSDDVANGEDIRTDFEIIRDGEKSWIWCMLSAKGQLWDRQLPTSLKTITFKAVLFRSELAMLEQQLLLSGYLLGKDVKEGEGAFEDHTHVKLICYEGNSG